MRRFRRHSEFRDLERQLRSRRSEPRQEFLSALADSLSARTGATGIGRLRVALAASLTLVLLAAFAAFGGMGYAASAASQQAKQIVQVSKAAVGVNTSSRSKGPSVAKSPNKPDQDQYKPGKGCGDKNHIHERENECKKPPK